MRTYPTEIAPLLLVLVEFSHGPNNYWKYLNSRCCLATKQQLNDFILIIGKNGRTENKARNMCSTSSEWMLHLFRAVYIMKGERVTYRPFSWGNPLVLFLRHSRLQELRQGLELAKLWHEFHSRGLYTYFHPPRKQIGVAHCNIKRGRTG